MHGINVFLQNKYTKTYDAIIAKARLRHVQIGYTEKHHIIPKSLGGGNGHNLVRLNVREHFICHWLLIRMMPIPSLAAKMENSLRLMRGDKQKKEIYDTSITRLVYANL